MPDRRSFGWQDGYASFTVSHSNVPPVVAYIEGQLEHHKRMSFHDELILLLQKHQIEFDEQYLV